MKGHFFIARKTVLCTLNPEKILEPPPHSNDHTSKKEENEINEIMETKTNIKMNQKSDKDNEKKKIDLKKLTLALTTKTF